MENTLLHYSNDIMTLSRSVTMTCCSIRVVSREVFSCRSVRIFPATIRCTKYAFDVNDDEAWRLQKSKVIETFCPRHPDANNRTRESRLWLARKGLKSFVTLRPSNAVWCQVCSNTGLTADDWLTARATLVRGLFRKPNSTVWAGKTLLRTALRPPVLWTY